MKVVCHTNALAELYLTPYHRTVLERYVDKARPVWNAEIGTEYTVYAVSIYRACPFYCVNVPRGWGDRWGQIPSICFDIIDPRPSQFWHFEAKVIRSGGNEVFSSRLAIPEWINEPRFLEYLVDDREREVAIFAAATAKMDAEFE
jgi:hypothetical protein